MKSMSRRSFIQGISTAAAVTILAPRTVLGANDRIRIAVIGCRRRGAQVAEAMLDADGFDIATLCDCDSASYDEAMKSLAAKLPAKPKFEQDFRRVLEDPAIDAVLIATPDHWHAMITVMALAAGKHVYVEKPASFNVRDTQAMFEAQNKFPNQIVLVGTQQRSGPHYQEAKAFLQAGALGKIAFCRAWISHRRETIPIVPDSPPPPSLDYEMWVGPAPFHPHNIQKCHYNWHFIKDFGTGEMGNWGAHQLDIGRWFLNLDLPAAAMGLGGTYVVHDAKETPDTQTVLYEFPELTMMWEQRLWTEEGFAGEATGVEFIGDKGAMRISRGGWTFTPDGGKPERHKGSELMLGHVANFADSIRGKAKPIADIHDGGKTAIMCHMGNICVALNRRIQFDPKTMSFPGDDDANAYAARTNRSPWDKVF